ncbi:hypothetical protein MYP_4780 [Sporocytophaga myxococcoides]|uniref:Uncharacterized protein n=1 Tax=Sporocytophaga myxococcoides TaxID=153721 RepID=A0A098LKQ8_9BACT|nr:hypothetical protein [Sporocytophaga myxococcoides]GAL87550.1 hypothetical protein MYP_4780 [Sporocytophaga myxococcoides]
MVTFLALSSYAKGLEIKAPNFLEPGFGSPGSTPGSFKSTSGTSGSKPDALRLKPGGLRL